MDGLLGDGAELMNVGVRGGRTCCQECETPSTAYTNVAGRSGSTRSGGVAAINGEFYIMTVGC